MTGEPNRIAAGVPAGGQFAAHTRAEASASLPRRGGPVRADELRVGDTIRHGSITLRAGAIALLPGSDSIVVSCEIGTLHLKADQQVIVADSDAQIISVDANAPSTDEFLAVLGGGLRRSEIVGDFFTRDSIESTMEGFGQFIEPDWVSAEAADAADEWLSSPESRDEVWNALRDTELFVAIDRHGYGHGSYDELESETSKVIESLLKQKGWVT